MAILVTGGAGYIGSHFVRELINKGNECVIFDNLSRGHIESVPQNVVFEKVDLLDYENLVSSLNKYRIEAVVHFAAFAYVGESVVNPDLYYRNNVIGTQNLLSAMMKTGIKKIVFSSTCSLYGNPDRVPITEEESIKPINPYAKTKYMIEMMLEDYKQSYGLKFVALRYFNAAGAASDSSIGESHDPETHLIPLAIYSALGRKEDIKVFGTDYNTPDGTCIRDYIHVKDLAEAHLKALEYLEKNDDSTIINLGTGDGNSVKEVIEITEQLSGKKIKSVYIGRRDGDPAVLVADNKKAKKVLNWEPKYNLQDIISDALNWHSNQKY